jgi:hypothetical protein
MSFATTYLHTLDGRLRVKVAEIKGLPANAGELEHRLRQVPGIDHATANPTTGNVLILYASSRISQQEILHTLYRWGNLREQRPISATMPGVVTSRPLLGDLLAETLVRSSVELALQGLVRALI